MYLPACSVNWLGRSGCERRGYSGRVSHRAVGSHPRWFSGRQNRTCTDDRRIDRRRGDAIGAHPRCKTCTLKHHQSCKGRSAKALGFNEVIDTSFEKLGDGVRRITDGYGADIVIDWVGGEVLGEALGAFALGGSLTRLGYAADRKATIDVTNLIGNGPASRASFCSLTRRLTPGRLSSLCFKRARSNRSLRRRSRWAKAANALRYLVEGCPLRQGRPYSLTGFDDRRGIHEHAGRKNCTHTGGNNGIGLVQAKQFVSEDAHVFITWCRGTGVGL
jgi:hypothetical protein